MSSTPTVNERAPLPGAGTIDLKLDDVVIPVNDIAAGRGELAGGQE